MSVIVFERKCPKCNDGNMVYRSKTVSMSRRLVVTYYVRFVCDTCYHSEEII